MTDVEDYSCWKCGKDLALLVAQRVNGRAPKITSITGIKELLRWKRSEHDTADQAPINVKCPECTKFNTFESAP